MRPVPLPFSCQHEAYSAGIENDHGDTVPGWLEPVAVACFWWDGGLGSSSVEPLQGPTGGDTVIADRTLIVDQSLMVDQRDRFTVDGKRFEVSGLPKDFIHGPFGFSPDRLVVELKRVG